MEPAKLFIGEYRAGDLAAATFQDEGMIGRAPDNALVFDDPKVSRHHAAIRRTDGTQFMLRDLGSLNGTLLNGRRILVPEPLYHRDVIEIGAASITFHHPDSIRPSPPAIEPSSTTVMCDPAAQESVAIGNSAAMSDVFRLMAKAAALPIPVLISGETGTGKELVARGIHRSSTRAYRAFIAVNCAAFPETLLESQLFGHRKGAFTGADRDRVGLFESAHQGTIFLDEVGEMPLGMQVKLLRVLQEGEVVPLGETKPRIVDVRVVSATNRDLTAEIDAGRFRRDLYFRLSAFPITLPPLRDRDEDIPLLIDRFLTRTAHQQRKRVRLVSPSAMRCLTSYDWPGNVRELQNEMQRAVAMVDGGDTIELEHLGERLRARAPQATVDTDASDIPTVPFAHGLRDAKAQFEAQYITTVLREHGGNVSRAAQEMGLSRIALHRKIKEYGIR